MVPRAGPRVPVHAEFLGVGVDKVLDVPGLLEEGRARPQYRLDPGRQIRVIVRGVGYRAKLNRIRILSVPSSRLPYKDIFGYSNKVKHTIERFPIVVGWSTLIPPF